MPRKADTPRLLATQAAAVLPVVGPLAASKSGTGGGARMPPVPAGGNRHAPWTSLAPRVKPLGLHSRLLRARRLVVRSAENYGETLPPMRLNQSAEQSYSRAMGLTTKANKFPDASKPSRNWIDRGVVAATRKVIKSKANTQVQSLGQQIGDAFDNLPGTDSGSGWHRSRSGYSRPRTKP